jgi:capsular exopolysaccharide synthesis family protein
LIERKLAARRERSIPMTSSSEKLEADPVDPSQGVYWSFLQVIWRRKLLLVIGLAVGLAGGGLYYAQTTPTYQSSAQVMVIRTASNPIAMSGTDPGAAAYEDFLGTHQDLIKSPLIVQQAVEKSRLGELRTLAGVGDPASAIIASLAITYGTMRTNILNLTFRGPYAEDCPTILNAVIDTYTEFLALKYKTVSDETLRQITQVTETLQKDLAKKEAAYADFRKQSELVYWRGNDGKDPQEEWLYQLQAKRLNLELQKAELQARVTRIENALRQGMSREDLLALIRASSPKAAGKDYEANLDDQLFQLRVEEQKLLAHFGRNHPEVVAVRRRIAMLEEFNAGLAARRVRDGQGDVKDPVQAHLQSLRQEIADAEVSARALTELFENEQKGSRELLKYKAEDKRHRDDITRVQNLFEPIIKRLEEIKLFRDMGGYEAQAIAPPRTGHKIRPIATQVFPLAAGLGLLAGLALAYLAEISDKRFRSPDEIRRRLGLPVIGHIPVITAGAAAKQSSGAEVDPLLCTFYDTKSPQAEAFRGLRTALYFSTEGEPHKVIQVTSPDMKDGKSLLAANLAVSIAQSGKTVILLDADLRRPRQHKLFGVSSATGLVSVMAETEELKDAIQPTPVPGLSLLPCGQRPPNPAELLTSPRFEELVETLREQFDFVVIDSPPLLAVSDPCVVAPRVDGVLLVIRVSEKSRPNAERAREILGSLGVTVIGVVVNCGGRELGSRGYLSGYAYEGYPYAYEYKQAREYYQVEEDGQTSPDGRNAAARENSQDHPTRTNGRRSPGPDAASSGEQPS